MHRATWAYSRAISTQRRAVLSERSSIVNGDQAMSVARRIIPEHMSALESDAGVDAIAAILRAVFIHYLDQHWVSHLSLLQEIRDGIHLQALAGHNPADEFHRIALREFQGFFRVLHDHATDFVRTLSAADIARDLDELGLRRPSSTWTHMVTDDPYGNAGGRLATGLGKQWRRKVLKIA